MAAIFFYQVGIITLFYDMTLCSDFALSENIDWKGFFFVIVKTNVQR